MKIYERKQKITPQKLTSGSCNVDLIVVFSLNILSNFSSFARALNLYWLHLFAWGIDSQIDTYINDENMTKNIDSSHLLVEKYSKVSSTHGRIGELHKIGPIQRRGLLAPSYAAALRDAERLFIPIRISGPQALTNQRPNEDKKKKCKYTSSFITN